MATSTTPLPDQKKKLQDENLILYHPVRSDHGHLTVWRFRENGRRQMIGHVYTEVDGAELLYVSTNRSGRELFSRSTEFHSVNLKFEKYARQLAWEEKRKKEEHFINTYSQTKNVKIMEKKSQAQEWKSQR